MEDQIKATIASANNHVLQAYNKLEELGATMPEHKNIENLRDTVYTLPLNVPKVSVTFDTGEGSPVVEEVFPGQTVSKPVDPTKEGCFFLGWHKQTGGGYDPENPTLAGLQNALAAGDYAAFPAGTEIPDTYDGQSNPLIVAQYLDSTNNSSYGGAEGVILVRKYVEPTAQTYGANNNVLYNNSSIHSYLQTTYLNNCSDILKSMMSDINIKFYTGTSYSTLSTKWFAMDPIELLSTYGNSNWQSGTAWDYWKQKTGLSAPASGANTGRIGRDRNGTAYKYWLRSKDIAPDYMVISTNGQGDYATATQSWGILPACFIAKPSVSTAQSQAITAQEYNNLNLTAAEYNAKHITAHDYNTNAKGVL